MVIGIDHDTVCAGVVCAATPGTARVVPAVAPAGTTNRLVSDVIINWHAQRTRRKMSLIPSALPNVLFVTLACRWIIGIVKILNNDATEPDEITNTEIYRLKFILKRHVFVLHVTSVNTGSVQVTHRAVGARTMHAFGTDLVRNPAIWLVESRD